MVRSISDRVALGTGADPGILRGGGGGGGGGGSGNFREGGSNHLESH